MRGGELSVVVVSKAQEPVTNTGKQRPFRLLMRPALVALTWLVVALGAVLLGAALWIRRTFGPITVDQLLSHIPGAGGAEMTAAEIGYAKSFVLEALVIPLISAAVLLALFYVVRLRLNRPVGRFGEARASTIRRNKVLPVVLSVSIFVLGTGVFANTVDAWQYLRSQFSALTMGDYYVSPGVGDQISLTAETGETVATPKNLVFIFLESIEDQMANGELFEQNMLEPLENVTEGWQTIPDYQVYEGGGWTMAGLVGTSCGVPLRGAGIGENDIGSNEIGSGADVFMPGADCLGDVLASEGYTNVFLGGADAQFASKAAFFESHGYQEVKDLSTWVEAGETELSGWGLSDRRLFENAKEEVVSLHESGAPFNLTLLTLDSHEPTHMYDYCEQTTEDALESAVRCSMEQVADFINFMGEMGYLEDTVIVLSGDHPKMVGEAFVSLGALGTVENRSIFNRIWSPEAAPPIRAGADQLSMFATVLDLMGLGREDHRAGVGVSALVDSAPGSVLDLDQSQYSELIQARSKDLYDKLWDHKLGAKAA